LSHWVSSCFVWENRPLLSPIINSSVFAPFLAILSTNVAIIGVTDVEKLLIYSRRALILLHCLHIICKVNLKMIDFGTDGYLRILEWVNGTPIDSNNLCGEKIGGVV
jgi:hypothetical protein